MTRTPPAFTACAAAAALALAAATARAALPRPADVAFDKGALFAVAGYEGAETLTNFPVLVRIGTNSPAEFSYADLHSPTNGDDLAFVGMDGAGLPFEIDTWDTNGTSLAWVRLPSMTNGTRFAMCWGADASGKTVCADNPFAGYKGVWHMDSIDPADSSTNRFDGTHRTENLSVANGPVGAAVNIPRTNTRDGISCGNVLPNAELVDGYTIEGWCRPTQYGGMGDGAAMFGKGGFASLRIKDATKVILTTPGKTNHEMGLASGVLPAVSNWWHFAATFKLNTGGNGLNFYVDGRLVKTQAAYDATNKTDATELFLGNNQWNQAFKGDLDEIRLSAGLRSADWVAADFATQSNPGFLAAGEAEYYVEPPSPTASLSVPSVGFTNATLAVAVTGLGAGAGSADVVLEVSATADFAALLHAETQSLPGTGSRSFAVGSLATNATYHARAFVTNDLHVATAIGPVSFATLAPASPALTASFGGRTGSSLAATVVVSSTGADSATIRLEASTNGFETVAAASAPVAAVPGQATEVSVGGLEPLTPYDLRAVVRNDWGLETAVVLGRFSTLPASGLAELYVDSLGSGDGSSPASALPTIRAALDRAAAGYTIWVRGGEGRAYGVTNETDTIPIPAELAGLSIRAYADTPGDGGRAIVAISDTYIDDHHSAHIVSNAAANATIEGLSFQFGKYSTGRQNVGSCGIVWTCAPDTTVANCLFHQAAATTYAGSGVGYGQICCATAAATNLLVRGCEFRNTRCGNPGHGYYPIRTADRSRIVGNIFTNVNGTARMNTLYGSERTVVDFVSNVVFGANSTEGSSNSAGLWTVYGGKSSYPMSGEIAYNRFVADPAMGRHQVTLRLGGGLAGSVGDVHPLVHHNTIIGGEMTAIIYACGGSATRTTGIFDNLFLLAEGATVLCEMGSPLPSGQTTAFSAGSFLRNNAWLSSTSLVGGSATELEGYDLAAGLDIADNVILAAPPEFVCTNDIYSADYYRYRSNRLQAVDIGRLGWRGENGEYPLYIGAVPPLYPRSTLVILK